MSVASIVLLSAVTGVISFGYIAFGVYLFRRRDGIGVSALSVFCGVWGGKFILGSVAFYILSSNGITSAAELRPSSLPDTTVLLVLGVVEPVLSALLTVTGIFAWLWFVLLYTRRVGSREKIAVGVIGGGTFLTLLLNGVVGAAASFGFIVIDPVLQTGITEFATVVEILGTGIAVGVGLSLLYSTVTTHHRFTESSMVGLTLPIVFPWLVGYLYTFSLVTSFQSINVLRGVTLAIGLVGLWLTVTEYGLFEQLPASQSVGRKTAFNSSDTAIVVVNNDGNVSDLNQAACELCEVTATECIGKSFESLVPESVSSDEIRTPEPTTFEMPGSDTIVEATTTEATDETGQTIGETVVLTDITAERRRQQRIQVLNRVLRHPQPLTGILRIVILKSNPKNSSQWLRI